MNLTIITAMKQGWTPAAPGTPAIFMCEAGCGRSVSHFKTDPTAGYCCSFCKIEAAKFIEKTKRDAKADKLEEPPA